MTNLYNYAFDDDFTQNPYGNLNNFYIPKANYPQQPQLYWQNTPHNTYYLKPAPDYTMNGLVNPYMCGAEGFAQGVSLNYADEIMGALGALYGKTSELWKGPEFNESLSHYYTNARDSIRLHHDLCKQQYPAITYGTEFAGLAASPIKMAKLGAWAAPTIGAISGFGDSEGNWQKQLSGISLGAASGYLGNASGNFLINTGKKYAEPFAEKLSNLLKPATHNNYTQPIKNYTDNVLNNPFTQDYLKNSIGYGFNQLLSPKKKKDDTYGFSY